ncbi:NifB/NifX family molybdenum-iron cluster-binding protein [Eggerthellaceae bacterium 3-80]|nr:dinitrogenase iron-molybdenum cofactor biosynthesis protein [bacterium D16-34]
MRIAVASDGLNVSVHSGRCASYMCYTVERGVITECQNLPNPCLPPASTAELLASLGIDLFFANTIDPNIRQALEQSGIEVVSGMHGSARESVECFITDMMNGSTAFEDEADYQLSN